MQDQPPPSQPPFPGAAASAGTPAPALNLAASPCIDSQSLLRGHKAVTIEHNGAQYRLQATKLGKLILTK